MVEYEGDLLIIGGETDQNDYLKYLWNLSCTDGEFTWNKIEKPNLKTPRGYHVAFVVPYEICK